MAVGIGTITSAVRSFTGTDAGVYDHTVDADTTLLIFSTHNEATESVTGGPQWSRAGGQNLTLIRLSDTSSSSSDVFVATYALLNPDPGLGDVTCTHSSNDNRLSVAVNFSGTTNTGAVTDVVTYLEEIIHNTASATSVFSSAGTAGNALYLAGTLRTGITAPIATNNASFATAFDDNSGATGGADNSAYDVYLLDNAPQGPTITWGTTEESAAHYLEIEAAAAGGANPKGVFGLPLHGPFAGPIGP